jgi:hypothetical protein
VKELLDDTNKYINIKLKEYVPTVEFNEILANTVRNRSEKLERLIDTNIY